jgi:hypothetical protein
MKRFILYACFIFMVFVIGSIFEGYAGLPKSVYIIAIIILLIYTFYKDDIDKAMK